MILFSATILLDFMMIWVYHVLFWGLGFLTDSSKLSLKIVLLQWKQAWTNTYLEFNLDRSQILSYQSCSWKAGLQCISMDHLCWPKMVNFLLGQQIGYLCFLCMRNSRARNEHWNKKHWSERSRLQVDTASLINESLIPREKIVFTYTSN